jgi:Concanavalin A-like lectin/glucanases superfamily
VSRLYVNANLAGTESHGTVLALPAACRFFAGTPADNVCTGSSPHEVGNDFRGMMDDVRVYRRALSASEITELANE